MRQLGWGLTPAFVLALALSATAQEKPVTTDKNMADTVKVTMSGDVQLDYVFRSAEVSDFISFWNFGAPNDSVNTFEGRLGIRFNVEMSDKVSAVVEFGTERVQDGSFNTFMGDLHQFSGQEVVLTELHVNIDDFLSEGVRLQAGIPTWSFDVRGQGNSFAFDPRHSNSISKNVFNLANSSIGDFFEPAEQDAVGLVLTYGRENLTIDVVVLPMVNEGGNPSEDEALYAVDLIYRLDNAGSRVGAIIALSAFDDVGIPGPDIRGVDTNVFTIGGGATLRNLVENLELYGEVYFQFGGAGTTAKALGSDALDAGGFAFQIGAEYTLPDSGIQVGVNLTFISGDDSDDPTDDEVGNFLAYDNINDLLILEDMYFGLDVDSNYFAVKINADLPLSVGNGRNNLILSAILGLARSAEDYIIGANEEDALGTEFDARARWQITKQAALQAAIGFLFGSDILEESMGGAANDDAEDTAIIYTLGADLRF